MKKSFFRFDPSLLLLPLLFYKANPDDLFIFLLSVFLHEAGHFFAILCLGYQLSGFSLSLVGAKIRLSDPYIPYKKEIFIYLSGPIMNFFGCLFAFFLLRWRFTRMGVLFFFSNLLLALFNLLPLPGLDGEGALSSFLSLFLSPDARDETMRKIKALFLLFLFFASLSLILFGKNPSLLILSLSLQKENEKTKRKKATKIS